MNRRIALSAILLLGLMASAATVLAREAFLESDAPPALPNRPTDQAPVGREMPALRAQGGEHSGRQANSLGALLGLALGQQDSVNDNGDANDNGDGNTNDNANDNGDGNTNDNGDDNTNDNGDGDDNANDNGKDDENDGHNDDPNDHDGGNDDHDDRDNGQGQDGNGNGDSRHRG